MRTTILMLAAASTAYALPKFERISDLLETINAKLEETQVNIQNFDAKEWDQKIQNTLDNLDSTYQDVRTNIGEAYDQYWPEINEKLEKTITNVQDNIPTKEEVDTRYQEVMSNIQKKYEEYQPVISEKLE